MKKILLFLLLFSLGYTAKSQVLITLLLGDKLNSESLEFGLEGGFNWSTIQNMDADKFLTTFNLGFYFNFRIKEPWYFYTGTLVKSKLGTDNLSNSDLDFLNTATYPEGGNYAQHINYFLVPALAKYKFKNNIYLEAGPQFGLVNKAFVQYDSDIDGRKATIKEKNIDMINRFDMGLVGGAGYTLLNGRGLSFGMKYYYGFIDVYKDKSGTKNSSIFLNMNIPVGAVK